MQRAQGLRCIALTAPAGAGKTALLRTWSGQARQAQVHLVWVTPVGGRLAAELARQCVALHPPLADALPSPGPVREGDEETALAAIAIALVRHAAALPRPIAFVFDELHTLDEHAALQGLQPLLDYCPPRVQCVFAARAALPLSLGRLRAHGELLELGADDLRWTPDEARALVRAWLGPTLAAERTETWLTLTDGWSLGLASISRAARERAGDDALLAPAFGFLQSQVLDGLPRERLELLTDLAATEVFDAPLAGLLSGRPPPECLALLEDFAQRTGFLRREPDGRWWRLQATLGLLLRERFARRDAAAQRRLHRRASAWFAEAGLQFAAVDHAVRGGDARGAATLVERWAGPLFREGHHDQLAALVRLVPPAAAARQPRLRLWSALLALMEHRYGDCRATLHALRNEADPADAATRRQLRVLEGWLAVFVDDMEAAVAAFPEGGAPTGGDPAVDDITLAGERNVLSWIHIYRNDYQRARDVQALAAPPAGTPRGTLFGTLSGRCLAGLSLALEGRMASAERTYREVLDEAEAHGASCTDPAVLAAGLLGETLYELNDLDGVLALEARLPELRRRSLPDPFLRVVLAMLRTHTALGRLDEALRHQHTLEAVARERGLERLLSYALLERIRLSLLAHDPDSAAEAWGHLVRLRRPHGGEEGTALAEVGMVIDRAEIHLLLYRGRLAPARERVDALLRLSERRGRRRRVAALHFQRAAIDAELGDADSAARHALLGLRLGARLGLVRSLLDAHPAVPALLDGALALAGPDAALAFHADRLRAAAGLGPLKASGLGSPGNAPAAPWPRAAPLPELSEREALIAQQLALALPNKEIARLLGLSPETVKWHLRNLYAKLGVSTRYAAVALLRERG